MHTLVHQIQDVLFESLLVKVDSAETDLLAAGLLDSLRLIDLLTELELRFEVRFDYQALEYEDFRSPAAIAALVARSRNGGAAARQYAA